MFDFSEVERERLTSSSISLKLFATGTTLREVMVLNLWIQESQVFGVGRCSWEMGVWTNINNYRTYLGT